MSMRDWLAFVAAAALIGLVPGPGVMSIVGCALSTGRRVALAAVAGMAVGNAVAMSLSLAGVGVLLAASAAAFTALKWAGAVYLVAMGLLALLRSGRGMADGGSPPLTARAAFAGTVAVGTFHPKTIVFFVAFVPQFISRSGSYWEQAALLIATFVIVVACTDAAYAVAASRASEAMRGERVRPWLQRAGGAVLIASGVATAAARN